LLSGNEHLRRREGDQTEDLNRRGRIEAADR